MSKSDRVITLYVRFPKEIANNREGNPVTVTSGFEMMTYSELEALNQEITRILVAQKQDMLRFIEDGGKYRR